uniref:MFS domain-containing protein n=1 Tax=Soboliphyme baturini TaxID=241478 RepID=A0A183I9Z8_9BILA
LVIVVFSDEGFEVTLKTYAIVSGLFQTFYALGAFVGSTGGSMLTDWLGFNWAATCIAVLNVIQVVIFIFECFPHFQVEACKTLLMPVNLKVNCIYDLYLLLIFSQISDGSGEFSYHNLYALNNMTVSLTVWHIHI